MTTSLETRAWKTLFHASVYLTRTHKFHHFNAWRILWAAQGAVTQYREPEYGELCSSQRSNESNQRVGSPDLEQKAESHAAVR